MPPGSYATIPVLDHGKESSVHKVPSYQIDAANLATWLTGWGDYKTALGNILLGNFKKETVVIYNTTLNDTAATSPFAQRELKLLVRYSGNTNQKGYELEIACPDLAALTFADGPQGKTDFIVLADGGVMAAWKTAFEAIARSPEDDAENVTVDSVQVVGRNL